MSNCIPSNSSAVVNQSALVPDPPPEHKSTCGEPVGPAYPIKTAITPPPRLDRDHWLTIRDGDKTGPLIYGGILGREEDHTQERGFILGRVSNQYSISCPICSQKGTDLLFFLFFKPSNNSLLTHIIVTINNGSMTTLPCSYHQKKQPEIVISRTFS